MRRFLISYDISNNKSRKTAANLLLDLGERIQRSVYIIEATENALNSLSSKITDLLEDTDSLLILPCCHACWEKARFAHAKKSIIIVV